MSRFLLQGGWRGVRWLSALGLASVAAVVPLTSTAEEPVTPRPVQPIAQAAAAQDAGSDLNGDGEGDLVVAGDEYRPRYNVPTWTLTVVYGSSKGLSGRGNELWRETDFASGKPTRGQITALATGDFDGDGFDDVAVGTDVLDESEDLSKERIGEVRILFGSRPASPGPAARSSDLRRMTEDRR